VDDGSTDGTGSVVGQWHRQLEDEELRLVLLRQHNTGPAGARNAGLIASRGEFIQYLDSDDLLRADKLTIQVARLVRDAQADITYAHTAHFLSDADWSAPHYVRFPDPDQQPLAAFLHGNCWPAPSALLRRSLCCALGPWDDQAPILEDWDYGVRLLLGEAGLDFLEEVLLLYRQGHDERPTMTSRAMTPASLRGRYSMTLRWLPWIRAAGQLDDEVQAWISSQLFAIAGMCLSIGETATARDVLQTLGRSGLAHHKTRRGEDLELFLAKLPGWCSRPCLRGLFLALETKDQALSRITKGGLGPSAHRRP
jgi:hypothetical protein